ncbi:MAG: indole-3-glycerol phosphate synthase TrpC [Candidatus Omnitrophota bacterium]|jgi:indole-3-glycerol phosphate synthase
MKKNDTLKEIVLKKKERLLLAKQALPEEAIKAALQGLAPVRGFMKAINKPHTISLIAEIKKASPSRGVIRQDFDPAGIARIYKDAGAQALSVLTEEDFFQGSPSFIQEVKNAVDLPVLRKDFILEPYHVYESRLLGADAILLIADLLSKDSLAELLRIASEVGLECLVEAHTEKDLKKILSLKAPLIGINNRDLHTLEVDPKTIERLFIRAPKDKVVIAESGIKSASEVLFLKILGVKAVLIGQAFMEAGDIKQKVEEVMGW